MAFNEDDLNEMLNDGSEKDGCPLKKIPTHEFLLDITTIKCDKQTETLKILTNLMRILEEEPRKETYDYIKSLIKEIMKTFDQFDFLSTTVEDIGEDNNE